MRTSFYKASIWILSFNNSSYPQIYQWNFRYVIFMLILVIDGWCLCCEITHRWIALDLTDDKTTLVQVMAWCHQETSHYLSRCWPSFMSWYGVIRPQWVRLYVLQWSLTVILMLLCQTQPIQYCNLHHQQLEAITFSDIFRTGTAEYLYQEWNNSINLKNLFFSFSL